MSPWSAQVKLRRGGGRIEIEMLGTPSVLPNVYRLAGGLGNKLLTQST